MSSSQAQEAQQKDEMRRQINNAYIDIKLNSIIEPLVK